MKNKNSILTLLCLFFVSCGEDRRLEYIPYTAQDRWIESVMQENYYWYQDMPDSKGLNYFLDPADFLKKLLSSNDASYSYIEDPNDTDILKSYGMLMDVSFQYNSDTAYAVRILHIDSDSPAEEAGLKRGDWLIRRNDKYITRTRVDSLYKGDAITVTLGEYEEVPDENDNPTASFKEKGDPIRLAAARITKDNPIHYYNTYSTSRGNVGYLVYNHFTQGTDTNDFTYDNQLRTISNSFKSGNLTNFILDLRYNAGGSLESAQLLGSILAPASAIGNTMCTLEYNDKQTEKNEDILFSNDVLSGGSNLSLPRLYIITGSQTAATSDVLINSLKPYMKVILCGIATGGNHTGTHTYINEEYPEIFHLVDCILYNADGDTRTSGFSPDYTLENESSPSIVEPFGSSDEVYLSATLQLIASGEAENTETRSLKPLSNYQPKGKQIRGTTIGKKILFPIKEFSEE